MFGNLGAGEIILILLVILILFGAKKIPELARGIGKGMSEFKKGLKDVEDEIKTYLKQYLPSYKIPDRFIPWPEKFNETDIKLKRQYFRSLL